VLLHAQLHAVHVLQLLLLRPQQTLSVPLLLVLLLLLTDSASMLLLLQLLLLQQLLLQYQMVLLLAEALQELFFPWVEASAGVLAHLSTASPHEDVRSYAMAG
jgi:hypothetical protein